MSETGTSPDSSGLRQRSSQSSDSSVSDEWSNEEIEFEEESMQEDMQDAQDNTGDAQPRPNPGGDPPNPEVLVQSTVDPAIASLTAALRQMLSQPPVVEEAKTKISKVDKPIMGDLVEMPSGDLIPWCGAHPNSEWTGPDKSASKTVHPGQYRNPQISSAQKAHSLRIQGLQPKFKASDNRITFEQKVLEHLELHGLFSVSCVPNPANQQEMISCVTNHPRLHVKRLPELIAPQLRKYDKYDHNNDSEAKMYLLNSIHEDLATELRSVTTKDDPFPYLYLHLMKIVRNVSIDYCNTIKQRIRSRHPSQYPGQNLAQMAIDFRADIKELEIAGQYEHNLSLIILEAFLSAGGSQPLEQYKHSLRILHDKLEDTLLDIGFMTQVDATKLIIKEGLTVRDICRIATDKYRSLASRDKWPPARHNPDSKAAPAKFGAYALLPHDQKTKKKGGCFNCGSLEHMARDCPEPKKDIPSRKSRPPLKQQRPNTNPKRHENRNPWKRTPPGPSDSQTKQVQDKTWHWCEKCGRWSLTHGTNEHTSPTDAAPKHQANIVMNHSAWHTQVHYMDNDSPMKILHSLRPMLAMPSAFVALGLALPYLPSSWVIAPLVWLIVGATLIYVHRQSRQHLNVIAQGPIEPPPRWIRRQGPAFTKRRKRYMNRIDGDKLVSEMRPWFQRHPPAPNKHQQKSRHQLQRQQALDLPSTRVVAPPVLPSMDLLRKFNDDIRFQRASMHASSEERETEAHQYTYPLPSHQEIQEYHKQHCTSCDACMSPHLNCASSDPAPPKPRKPRYRGPPRKPKYTKEQKRAIAEEMKALAKYVPEWQLQHADISDAYLHVPLAENPNVEASDNVEGDNTEVEDEVPFVGTAHAYVATLSAPIMSIGAALKAAFTSPAAVRENLDKESQFKVIWDTGASISISPSRGDFVGSINKPPKEMKIAGIQGHSAVTGIGKIAWSFTDHDGMLRTLVVPALLVPSSKVRLLSINSLLNTYPDETIHHDKLKLTLSGAATSNDEPVRRGITVYMCAESHLPSTTAYSSDTDTKVHQALNASISCAANNNMNLSPAQRELLKWHCRLGHLSMKQTQFLMRTGVLAHSEKTRQLQIQATKSSTPLPMCAACQFAKQRQRSSPGTTKKVVKDRQGVMKADNLLPGQRVSVDHFVCSTKGRLTHTQGKEDPKTQYCGGALFVDHASGYIFIKEQVHLNTHETIDAKEQFELHCRDFGVITQTYLTDNGSAFTSAAYTAHLRNFGQIASFAGVGAHHHNGIAERSIQTVMSLARAMMLHSAVHWPEVADTKLWPLAVQHAVFLYNHVPTEASNGVSPADIFTKSRWPHARFHDLHVWGCPVYVLDKTIADGKKLPRWSVRSSRQMYMGVSAKHATSVPLSLNLETGSITAQFHVVFDDLFSTVTSSESHLPNFQSREWDELFGDATHHYVIDDDEEAADDMIYPDSAQDKAATHRETVEAAFDQQPSRPLEVTPPATTSLRNENPTPPQIEKDPISLPTPPIPFQTMENPFNMPPTPPQDQHIEQREHVLQSAPLPSQQRELPQPSRSLQEREPSEASDQRSSLQREKEAAADPKPAAPPSSPPKRKSQTAPAPVRPSRNRRPPQRLIHEMNMAELADNEPFTAYGIGDAPEGLHEYFASYLNNIANDLQAFKANKINTNPDILTYDQAMKSPSEREHWKQAAQEEIDALIDHETWDEVPMSEAESKIIPCTWNFRRKRAPDGSFKKHKGRICVRGDLEEEKPSTETYAPVVAWSSVRIFLILSLILQWTTVSIDFSNAFLHAVLKDPIWIHLPRGYISTKGPGTCLRLKKSLYGSSTSPKLWYDCISQALIKLGFKQTKYDSCFFYKSNMMIVLYVDDAGIAAKDPKMIDELIDQLEGLGFNLTKEGTFAEFLGIKFEQRDNNEFKLTQTGLIDKILKTTKMEDCKPNQVPTSQQALGADSDGLPMQEDWSYPSVVGMLLYLSTNSRPDIAFAVSQVCRFSSNPKQSHATAIKTIVRYLKGTRNEGTIIRPTKQLIVDLFVDADYCSLHGSEDSRSKDAAKSRTGYIVTICGCPTIWKSTLQSHISLSTLEAEYSALSFALKAFLPIKWLLQEIVDGLDLPLEIDTTIQARAFEDNQGALILARDQRITNRTKYFLTKWHWFWQHAKEFTLLKIESAKQCADYLTKPLPRDAFVNNRRLVQGW